MATPPTTDHTQIEPLRLGPDDPRYRAVVVGWLRSAIFFAIVYPVVGILFAALANPSASNPMRVTWRLAAWLVCAVAFAAHLGYEHFRLRSSPVRAALHVSVAVALGAFALAVWVNVHAHWVASSHQSPLAPLALVVFPAVTGAPAFVVALVTLAILARARRSPKNANVWRESGDE